MKEDAERLAKRLASFPQHNPNPVVEVDLDGNVTFVNPTAEEYASGSGESPGHPLAQDIGPLLGRLLREGRGIRDPGDYGWGINIRAEDSLYTRRPHYQDLLKRYNTLEGGP